MPSVWHNKSSQRQALRVPGSQGVVPPLARRILKLGRLADICRLPFGKGSGGHQIGSSGVSSDDQNVWQADHGVGIRCRYFRYMKRLFGSGVCMLTLPSCRNYSSTFRTQQHCARRRYRASYRPLHCNHARLHAGSGSGRWQVPHACWKPRQLIVSFHVPYR